MIYILAADDPTPANPGLRIVAPASARDARTFYGSRQRTPYAAYACRCGAAARVTGTAQVLALQTEYAEHQKTGCPANSLALAG